KALHVYFLFVRMQEAVCGMVQDGFARPEYDRKHQGDHGSGKVDDVDDIIRAQYKGEAEDNKFESNEGHCEFKHDTRGKEDIDHKEHGVAQEGQSQSEKVNIEVVGGVVFGILEANGHNVVVYDQASQQSDVSDDKDDLEPEDLV
ncbi:hypothetical protein BGZ80_008952, partial [Entomortierella chlamydospora]